MDFFKNFNNALYNKKNNFLIKKNKKNYNIILKLIKLNIIKYIKFKKNKILININLNVNVRLQNYNNLNLNLKKIIQLKNFIFLINTTKGLLLSSENINKKIGGLLIAKIIIL